MAAHNDPMKFISSTVLATLLLIPSSKSSAVEWTADPTASASTEYTDNYSLTSVSPTSLWSYNLSPQIAFGVSEQNWNLIGQAHLNRVEYPSDPTQSRTDHQFTLTYSRQSELDKWNLTGNLLSDSTQQTELTETGSVISRAQRSSRSLAPSWTHSLNETNSLTLGYNYKDVAYDNALGGNLLDFRTHDVAATLGRILTEKDQASISVSYSDYKSDNPPTLFNSQYDVKTASVQMGYVHSFSETLNGSLTAGMYRSDSTTQSIECLFIQNSSCVFTGPVSIDESSTGSQFNASLDKTFESSKLTTALSRSLQPTGAGGVVESTHLSLTYSALLAPTLNGGVTFHAFDTQQASGSSVPNNSRYYSLSPTLAWRITEWWAMNASYVRQLSQRDSGADATANAISLTLTYAWPTVSSSH